MLLGIVQHGLKISRQTEKRCDICTFPENGHEIGAMSEMGQFVRQIQRTAETRMFCVFSQKISISMSVTRFVSPLTVPVG